MAIGHIVLGLLIERSDSRCAIAQRCDELFPFRDMLELAEPSPASFGKDGSIGRATVPPTASKVAPALVSLHGRGLIEPAAGRGVPAAERGVSVADEEGETVYAVTSAGRAHFEWWMDAASGLDPLGNELRAKAAFSTELHAPRLVELAKLQEQVCCDRLEELRRSDERMTFARYSTLGE